MDAPIVLQQCSGHAHIILNQPAKHNALGIVALRNLQSVLRELAEDRALRVVTIAGAGNRTFCAGASLDDMESGAMRSQDFQDTTDLIAALPVPVVAVINGNVFGGGVELALACDFRIGVQGARLRVPAAALGLCYPIRGIQRFVHKLGVSGAQRLLLAAEEWSAQEMQRFGFLDELVAPESLDSVVGTWVDGIQALAPLSVRAMKLVIGATARGDLDLTRAAAVESLCAQSEDLQEGLRAQRERRLACFQGR